MQICRNDRKISFHDAVFYYGLPFDFVEIEIIRRN